MPLRENIDPLLQTIAMNGPAAAQRQLEGVQIITPRTAGERPVATPAGSDPPTEVDISEQQKVDNAADAANINAALEEDITNGSKLQISDPPEDVVYQPGYDQWKREEKKRAIPIFCFGAQTR